MLVTNTGNRIISCRAGEILPGQTLSMPMKEAEIVRLILPHEVKLQEEYFDKVDELEPITIKKDVLPQKPVNFFQGEVEKDSVSTGSSEPKRRKRRS